MRLTVKATCPMDLSYFPMDSQLCTLEIESYGYTMADLVYSWHDGLNSVQVRYHILFNIAAEIKIIYFHCFQMVIEMLLDKFGKMVK